MVKFGDSANLGLSSSCSFVRTFGSGRDSNHAGLWRKKDVNGNSITKVVLKEVYLDEDDWENEKLWSIRRRGDRMPMEAFL